MRSRWNQLIEAHVVWVSLAWVPFWLGVGLYVFPREWIWIFITIGIGPMVVIPVGYVALASSAAEPGSFFLFAGMAAIFTPAIAPVEAAPVTVVVLVLLRMVGKVLNRLGLDI